MLENMLDQPVTITGVAKNDIATVFEVERAVFGAHSYPEFFFRQAFDCWPEKLLVAKCEARVLGYTLWVAADDGSAWILSVAVRPSARGLGIGKRLVNAVVDAAKDYSSIRLTVDPENLTAVNLYRSAGFKPLMEEQEYFPASGHRVVYVFEGPERP